MNNDVKRRMRKSAFFFVLVCFCFGFAFQTWASELTPNKDNVLFYRNFENVFDANGQYKEPDPTAFQIEPGDHFAGIINVQHINVEGVTIWFQSPTDQITGIFAARVEAIVQPDTYDPTGGQILPHLVLGPPTVNVFCKGSDCFSTAVLEPGEIFALFRDLGATLFEYNGDMYDDVLKATDGELWLTLGYSAGGDNAYGTGDDDGYLYSHVAFGVPLANFTGESWGGLNAIRSNTGYAFGGINDPSENEIGDLLIPGLLNDVYLSNELEGNPGSVILGGSQPWDIASNDPAHMLPREQEEPTDCRVTAGGNKDGVAGPCVLKSNGMPDTKTCANDIYHTWGGQAGAQPRIDGNWTHHYKESNKNNFGFHSNDLFYIMCSDPGPHCEPAGCYAPSRQIDFAGIGRFNHKKGVYESFPDADLCFQVHLEDIGEPGRGGKWSSSVAAGLDCEHCPGTPIVNGNPDDLTSQSDCRDCTDYYEIKIYDNAAHDDCGCTGNVLWVNGSPDTVRCGPGDPQLEGFFTRAGNVQMHRDNNGP